MTYEATKSLDLEGNKDYITQNKDILTKKIRWDNYLKGFSYFMYSLFVSLLSLSFLFSGARLLDNQNFQYLDLVNIFIGLFTVLLSIGVIAWIYKGSLKKLFTINYYVVHLLNAVALSIIVIVMSLPMFAYPVSGTPEEILNMTKTHTLGFGLGIVVWYLVGGIALIINIRKLKGTFPSSWLKLKLSLVTLFVLPVLAMISWAASLMPEMKTIFLVVQLGIFVAGFLYTAFAFTYVKSFKELILSDKTEQEIQKIDFFRNISFLMILMPAMVLAILGINKALPIWEIWSNGQIDPLSLVSISLDVVILLAYLAIIIVFKTMGKKGKTNKLLSSIDNSMLMDFISWFLIVKTIVIVGLSKGVNIPAFMALSSCFLSIFLINISTIVIGVNFPNIKNTTSTVVNIIASMAILGMALFQSTFTPSAAETIFNGTEIIILTILPAAIASSINLGIKILSFSKINYSSKKMSLEEKMLADEKEQLEAIKASKAKESKVGA